MVRDAIEKGIDELCFTDHVDYGIKKDWDEPGETVCRVGGCMSDTRLILLFSLFTRWRIRNSGIRIFREEEASRSTTSGIIRNCYIWSSTITITAFWAMWI